MKCAYDKGYNNGRKAILQNLGKKLEEKIKEGQKEGIKIGKEKYYGKGIVVGECEEHNRWKAAGDGERCFMPTSVLDEVALRQIHPPPFYAPRQMSLSKQTWLAPKRVASSSNSPCHYQHLPSCSLSILGYHRHPYQDWTSKHLKIGSPTRLDMSQYPVLSENGQNHKKDSTAEFSLNCHRNLEPYLTSSDSKTPTNTSITLEMRSKPANFILNHQNVENPSFFSQKNTSTHSHNTVQHTMDVVRVHTSLRTPNDVVLQLPTPTMASSSS